MPLAHKRHVLLTVAGYGGFRTNFYDGIANSEDDEQYIFYKA